MCSIPGLLSSCSSRILLSIKKSYFDPCVHSLWVVYCNIISAIMITAILSRIIWPWLSMNYSPWSSYSRSSESYLVAASNWLILDELLFKYKQVVKYNYASHSPWTYRRLLVEQYQYCLCFWRLSIYKNEIYHLIRLTACFNGLLLMFPAHHNTS